MQPDEIAALAAVAQAVLAFAALAATVAVGVMVYIGTKRLTSFQLYSQNKNAWNAIDSLALSSDEMLRVADDLLPPSCPSGTPIDEMRRKWLGYLVVNACAERYLAAKRNLFHCSDALTESAKYTLRHVLRDDMIYRITQESGYEKEIQELCCEIREQLEAEKMLNCQEEYPMVDVQGRRR